MNRIDMIRDRLKLDPTLRQEIFFTVVACDKWTEVKSSPIIKAFIKVMKKEMPGYNTEKYIKTIFKMKEVMLDECEA